MGKKDIRFDILKKVVERQGATFATRDVSEDPLMLESHAVEASHSHYHSFVGGAISDHRTPLGLDEIRKGTTRGSIWAKKKIGNTTKETNENADEESNENGEDIDLGPQYKGDSAFTASIRRHQSWYRANILRVPYGTGPKSTDKSKYGNMLTTEHGARGVNFITPQIFKTVQERVSQGRGALEPYRLYHNLMTSQAMCFNLFAPLSSNKSVAKKLVDCMVPEDVKKVLRIVIEWNPEPKEEYLGDRTAFDAFIEYVDSTDKKHAIGIETKLTDTFSQKEYDGEKYRRWMRVADSPWTQEADNQVHKVKFNQLWRDHLLTVSLKYHPCTDYDKVRFYLVRHPEDKQCDRIVEDYRKLLKEDDDSFRDLNIKNIVESWLTVLEHPDYLNWLNSFKLRYLDLKASKSNT